MLEILLLIIDMTYLTWRYNDIVGT